MKRYLVFYEYDEDGGFGDRIPVNEFIGVLEGTDEEIDNFLNVYDNPKIYSIPYDALMCNGIHLIEMPECKKISDFKIALKDLYSEDNNDINLFTFFKNVNKLTENFVVKRRFGYIRNLNDLIECSKGEENE